MDAFCVVDNEGTVAKRDNGASSTGSHHHDRHRRSKSASDRNLKLTPRGHAHLRGKSPNTPYFQHMQPTDRSYWERSPLHHDFTCWERSPLHQDFTGNRSDASSNHRASLEKDIEHLQLCLQEEKSMRIMLERAMGRVSSTLSPGHRHLAAQTKDLITEIELLEEEVANREQQVLSLYRNIFDNCLSRAPSEQSSGMTSPAHTKTGVRKHPSIISSAFCSSKKFPLQPLQLLASIKGSRKKSAPFQSKTRRAPLSSAQTNIHIENSCAFPAKVNETVPNTDKTSLAFTLKDHLYQCPSKLSEELVRCMASIYCWLQDEPSTKSEKKRSPFLPRSSTSEILPRRGVVEDRKWSSSSTLEISWIAANKNQFSCASYAINNYRVLVEQLERVNPIQMQIDAQTAFWINVYNSLIMHAYLAYGIPQGSLRRIALFHKAAYNIGGYVISAKAIEQCIFCIRTPRTGWWFENIISTAMRRKSREGKQLSSSRFALKAPQPLICFAICTGALSDPMLRVYTSTNIREELELVKKEFLQANVVVEKSRKVYLPKILERFAKEACIGSDDLLSWVSKNVDKKLHDSIWKCIDYKARRKPSQIMEWLPYNTSFRYIFAQDLTEKPCWL